MAKRARKRSSVSRKSVSRRSSRRGNVKIVDTTRVPQKVDVQKKRDDLAAMYLSILIIGIAGIILLIAKPTAIIQKVIGILLVVLGVWGLLAKK